MDPAICGTTFVLICKVLPSFKIMSSLVVGDLIRLGFSEPKVTSIISCSFPIFKFSFFCQQFCDIGALAARVQK